MKEILNVAFHSSASLPSFEVMLLLTILTLCLLLKTNRLGLVTSYVFAYRWGWLIFERSFGHDMNFMYGYLFFGIMALTLIVISMVRSIN